ncbi:retrovirus-related pol polyprotein from transposon TNT 1-94 [Tanacetum coccineum]|uniref:Retrovirus-related pol polyprotein from transposon TNT 1-94 n=1 Tax=Tanacetum coccineum TaxID=301880 RepID=A0ABQ5A1L4_9ASTR
MNTSSGFGVSTGSDDTMNEDTPVGVASAVKEGVTPYVVDMMVEKKKVSALEDNTVPKSFPPLTTPVTTTVGNAHGISSYANITSKPSGKKVKVRTLFTPRGNGIDVVFLVDSIRVISVRFANAAYGFFLGKKVAYTVVSNYVRNTWGKYGLVRSILSVVATKLGTPLMLDSYTSDMCMQSWGRSSYARVMIELRADVELEDNIVVAMPKITREGHYTCNVHNTGAGEKKTMKKPSQTSRGISIGPKMGFKPQNEYQPIPKKSTASSSGNKKKVVEPTIEVLVCPTWDQIDTIELRYTRWVSSPVKEASSYARVMIELRADVELKDNIVVAMPKITREGHYTCNVHNTGAGEKKTMRKPSQTSRGISIGPKMGFKPQNEYRHVPKKSTASSSGNKKKVVEPTIEVSNSNPFDVLNLVDNNVDSSTIPIIDKIKKFEDFLISGQAILVDKAGNSLKNVEFPGEYDSEYENKDKFPDLPSFSSITNGIAKPTVDTSSTKANIRTLVLDDQDLINFEDPSMMLLVKLKDVNSMSNIYRKKDIKGVYLIEELSRIIKDVDNFNSFIDNSGLIDLPLGGHLFSWMNKDRTKLSKLDRFLISEEVTEALPNVRVTAIDHLWSDHNPILLHVFKSDFGPTAFKLFHSWLLHDSFDGVIKTELPKLKEYNFGRKLLSHEKFHLLKARIKQWHSKTWTLDRVTKHDN